LHGGTVSSRPKRPLAHIVDSLVTGPDPTLPDGDVTVTGFAGRSAGVGRDEARPPDTPVVLERPPEDR